MNRDEVSKPADSGSAVSRAAGADRFERLDALRGVAIVWMAVFHFCFDLNYFGYFDPRQRFQFDPFWTVQRTCIVTLFLLCAGMGQALAIDAGQSARRFWRRWAQVAGCAVLVSAGSAIMFPKSWISFGVLHGIAVMLLIVRWGAPRGLARGARGYAALLAVALAALLLPRLVQHPWFDSRWTAWVGLVTRLPRTEDFVPVLPWLGVMLGGVVLGHALLRHRRHWLAGTVPTAVRPLAVLGTWSLSFYMLHQPVLIGGIRAWRWWTTGQF
ncbi:heparan-alpha-glucosaminide N-acetyltransferase [Ideonella sp. DXS29W]|uniref:Heparan-alpha-glucosaminide N-acetyltransferase n=1 Tax=Ideonella lacteola TaxID=2984193 RepID=A0ABU9BW11_9BURK